MYEVCWQGTDPTTGKKWPNSFEPEANVTPDLREAYWRGKVGKGARGKRLMSAMCERCWLVECMCFDDGEEDGDPNENEELRG
jgi:hypothetical protein